ncbi:hypothetical protein FHG87_018254 [Trinorchestia longiramus]|nr:hypothetical protein FHG87_018254 [Trinorchestia longiramus]
MTFLKFLTFWSHQWQFLGTYSVILALIYAMSESLPIIATASMIFAALFVADLLVKTHQVFLGDRSLIDGIDKYAVMVTDKFFICEIHWGADPPLIKLRGGSMRPGIPPSIFNVSASCLPSPKPAPRPLKVEDQQLRYFLQKDKITLFDAFKPERNLQKQYKNLIISRSKKRLVCLFMTTTSVNAASL